MREALGSAAAVAKGALGISSETCAESGKERRTATSAPPAEILRAVANSRNSFPFSSRLRTNTGMARGRRVHLRRSVSGFRRFNPAPWIRTYARESRIWGAKPHTRLGRLQVKHPQMWDVSLKATLVTAVIAWACFRLLYARRIDLCRVWNGLQLQAFSARWPIVCIFR